MSGAHSGSNLQYGINYNTKYAPHFLDWELSSQLVVIEKQPTVAFVQF